MKNRIPTSPAPEDRSADANAPDHDDAAANAAMLDFTPVPRRNPRVDGWTAEVQRAFVAALAASGSRRRAAAAVGKAQFGVDQLLKAPGSEGFRAACDAAVAIARARGARRLAAGLEIVVEEAAAWTPPPAPWSRARSRARPPEPEPEADTEADAETEAEAEAEAEDWLVAFVGKYLLKVDAERAARMAGRIVEADFYLRQATYLEAMVDLMGTGGFDALRRFRESGLTLVDVAETPMSRILGDARRRAWARAGDPPRPAPTPRDLIADHGRFAAEPLESIRGGDPEARDAQRRAYDDRHARDAALQIEWEARARLDYEARQRKDAK